MPFKYTILDVFTDKPLSGNPLAVVYDADRLSSEQMAAVAGEFNLSETVFVCRGEAEFDAAIRIFTPAHELPFAGHPTVGTAVALARRLAAPAPADPSGERLIKLSLKAGPVSASVSAGKATFDAPLAPRVLQGAPSAADAAACFGLSPSDIGFDAVPQPVRGTSGPNFTIIPLRDWRTLAAAKPVQHLIEGSLGEQFTPAFLVAPFSGTTYRARMFAPLFGIAEDPATGSAAVAFAAALNQAKTGSAESFTIHQGFEMGRPSVIDITYTSAGDGSGPKVTVTGEAVVVAEGELMI